MDAKVEAIKKAALSRASASPDMAGITPVIIDTISHFTSLVEGGSRADLHKLKRVMSETGNPRLVADRDAEGHADRTWAAFLGLAGASAEPGIIGFYRRQAEALKEKR